MEHFNKLFAINVNDHTESKKTGGSELTYLSWCWAWAEVKKNYPDAQYTIVKFENNLPYVFDPKTGYMVFTNMTIEGVTHEMWLPVMNGANKAMLDHPYTYKVKFGNTEVEKEVEAATMFDINKTLMRCLVKNIAMFGLGLYIYAGEDLPEGEDGAEQKPTPKPQAKPQQSSGGGLTLAKAETLCFKNGKNANVPFKELSDHTLQWVVENMSGMFKEAAQLILDSRKQLIGMAEVDDGDLPF